MVICCLNYCNLSICVKRRQLSLVYHRFILRVDGEGYSKVDLNFIKMNNVYDSIA